MELREELSSAAARAALAQKAQHEYAEAMIRGLVGGIALIVIAAGVIGGLLYIVAHFIIRYW